MRVAATDPAAAGSGRRVELPAQPVPRTRCAEILAAAIPLFERDGFASVTNGMIAEAVGLPPTVRRPLVVAQREHIAVWEQQLRLARPELDSRQARALVHAGFGVVVEASIRGRVPRASYTQMSTAW